MLTPGQLKELDRQQSPQHQPQVLSSQPQTPTRERNEFEPVKEQEQAKKEQPQPKVPVEEESSSDDEEEDFSPNPFKGLSAVDCVVADREMSLARGRNGRKEGRGEGEEARADRRTEGGCAVWAPRLAVADLFASCLCALREVSIAHLSSVW